MSLMSKVDTLKAKAQQDGANEFSRTEPMS